MHEEEMDRPDLISVYDHEIRPTEGVELSPGKEELLTLVGRDGVGNTTFVMLLRTQLAPNSNGVKIASIEVVKEPKHSKSEAVVAIVSDHKEESRVNHGTSN